MRRTAPVLVAALAILASAPIPAQQVGFSVPMVRTYYGCAQNISCHLVTVTWSPSPFGVTGTIRSQSWFSNSWGAGYPWRLIVSPLQRSQWGFGDEYYTHSTTMQPYFDETFALDVSSAPFNWTPRWSQMSVSYGTPAGTPGAGPFGADIMLVQTPEPGSLILLATGLGGVMLGAARRRKRRIEAD